MRGLEFVVRIPLPQHEKLLVYQLAGIKDVALKALYQQLELLLWTEVVWRPTRIGGAWA